MPTSILIVGLGRGTAWAREILKAPDLAIAGLVDVDAEKLARVGAEVGVPVGRQYPAYERALRESGADIVVLAVPTPLHKEMSLAGLRSGHHVICEKPLAMNLEEAGELRQAVKRFDHRFMVGEQYRFADGVENIRRAIAAGLIGRVAYISHEFFRGAQLTVGRWAQGEHWSRSYEEAALHDMSVHHFDMWYYMTGSRCAEISINPFDVPWNRSSRKFGYSVSATLENGTHVDYITARALARPQTPWYGTLWIVGEDGALSWNGDSSEVTLSRVIAASATGDPQLSRENVAFVTEGIRGTNLPIVPMIRSLVEAIQAGRPHPCDIDENMASFATSMAAVESARTGHAVRVAVD
ncbi:MAG TPA: Gfo/Idh/MocA family oxidoreductase [Chloroflexota bacterium]|nr:Gfo/Idh/MocA family oxidoreductase [Chloroflexota bacterium]